MGFIRTYSTYLGLDNAEILRRVKNEVGVRREARPYVSGAAQRAQRAGTRNLAGVLGSDDLWIWRLVFLGSAAERTRPERVIEVPATLLPSEPKLPKSPAVSSQPSAAGGCRFAFRRVQNRVEPDSDRRFAPKAPTSRRPSPRLPKLRQSSLSLRRPNAARFQQPRPLSPVQYAGRCSTAPAPAAPMPAAFRPRQIPHKRSPPPAIAGWSVDTRFWRRGRSHRIVLRATSDTRFRSGEPTALCCLPACSSPVTPIVCPTGRACRCGPAMRAVSTLLSMADRRLHSARWVRCATWRLIPNR